MGLEDAGAGEFGIDLDRADVGEDVELGAQGEEAVLGAGWSRGVVPLGAADGAEEDGVGGGGQVPHLVGERCAVPVDRDAANVAVVQDEVMAEGAAHGLQGLDALRGNLGADAVAAEDGDVEIHSSVLLWDGRRRSANRDGRGPSGSIAYGLAGIKRWGWVLIFMDERDEWNFGLASGGWCWNFGIR